MSVNKEICPWFELRVWWSVASTGTVVQKRRMTVRAAWEWHLQSVRNGARRVELWRGSEDGSEWTLKASYTYEGA